MEQETGTHEFNMEALLDRRVVLDTQGPLIFIGRFAAFDSTGYWLTDADVHDRNDGHSNKEVYVSQACALEKSGNRNINRRKVFVARHEIVSISALDDIVTVDQPDDEEAWLS